MRIVAQSSILNSILNLDFSVRVFLYSFREVRIMLRTLKYWQAFATLPKFTDAESKIIGDCLTAPLDDAARKILTSSEYSLTMLHRAAAIPAM